jgi:hypothetical protein
MGAPEVQIGTLASVVKSDKVFHPKHPLQSPGLLPIKSEIMMFSW